MEKIKRNIMSELGRSKYTGWVLNLMSIIMVVGVGILLYWEFADYDILEELEGNYTLSKYEFVTGESFAINLHVCKNSNLPETVYGRFIDGVIYSLPEQEFFFEKGCYDTPLVEVEIPESLPTGTYYYEDTIEYKVNPIRTIIYTLKTPEFEVVAKGCDCD